MRSNDVLPSEPGGRFVRIAARSSPGIDILIDGEKAAAFQGESVLVAVLTARGYVRMHEFDGGPRAGFCLMGACQDCWVWLGDGRRVRACTTPVGPEMRILTRAPQHGAAHG
jgi:predicted molibdopterin-dependent oxidoreductase YjgC